MIIGMISPYGQYAPLSCRKLVSSARMRPSSLAPTRTWWTWRRSCVEPMKCSRRSSVHLTGIPSRRAAERDHDLLGIELDDLDAEAAADVRARRRGRCSSGRPNSAAEAVADAGRRLRGVVDQQPALARRTAPPRARPSSGVAALRSIVEAPLEHVRRVGAARRRRRRAPRRRAPTTLSAAVAVHDGASGRRRRLDVDDRRERLVVDDDRAPPRPRRCSGRARRPSRSSRPRSGPRRAPARTACGRRRSPRAG